MATVILFLFVVDTVAEVEGPINPGIRTMDIGAQVTSTDGHLQPQQTHHQMPLTEVIMPQNKTVHRVNV